MIGWLTPSPAELEPVSGAAVKCKYAQEEKFSVGLFCFLKAVLFYIIWADTEVAASEL